MSKAYGGRRKGVGVGVPVCVVCAGKRERGKGSYHQCSLYGECCAGNVCSSLEEMSRQEPHEELEECLVVKGECP